MGNKASSEELDDVHLSELLMTQLESLFRTFDLNNDGGVEMEEIETAFKNAPEEGKTVMRLFT